MIKDSNTGINLPIVSNITTSGDFLQLLVPSRKRTNIPKSVEKLRKARDLPQISFDTGAPLIDGINATTFWRPTPKRTINSFWRLQYGIDACKSVNTCSKLCSNFLPKERPVSAWIRPDSFPRIALPLDFTIMRGCFRECCCMYFAPFLVVFKLSTGN
jgi:hypothetical protein